MYKYLRFKFLLTIAGMVGASLAITSTAQATTLTQGYHSAIVLPVGTVVSVVSGGGKDLEKTTTLNESRAVGIIAEAQSSTIDVQNIGTNVRVAINGEVSILVSDLNGAVKKGSYLIASPLGGVAVSDLSAATNKKYLAIAEADFVPTATNSDISQIQLDNGNSKQVHVGSVKAQLLLSDRASSEKTHGTLNTIAERVAGRPVNNVQILASSAVFVTTISLSGLMLNGSVRGSFISLGRNPLSQQSIVASLVLVLALGLIIAAIGLGIAYLILVL